MWERYGPGAAGVGEPADAKRAAARSVEAWGAASTAAGVPADTVAEQLAGSMEFWTAS